MVNSNIDAELASRYSPAASRHAAHGYERVYLQDSSMAHSQILEKMLTDLREYMAPLNPALEQRLGRLQDSFIAAAPSLAEYVFTLGLADANLSLSESSGTVSKLQQDIADEVIRVLGYMPDSSPEAATYRRARDAWLASETGYLEYLHSTFGAIPPRELPNFYVENAVLQNASEWQGAVDRTFALGLPAHFQMAKNWDSLAALDCVMRRKGKDAVVLEAGTELYSVFLPSLFLYGYRSLFGNNLTFARSTTLGGIRYRHGDVTKMNFTSEMFDAMVCLSVVEHGVDLKAYLQEAARILKPGGILVTSTDYYPEPIDTKGAVAYGVPIHIFTRREMGKVLDMAAGCGLRLTGELNLDAREPAVRWDDYGLDYSFIIFTLEKMQ